MSRYIDADEIEDFISRWGGNSSAEDCLEWIKNSPTADVRENVRGEWIEVLRDTYGGGHFPYSKCSVCQSEQIMDSNFCPNCGADMRPITALSKNAEIDSNSKRGES